MRQFVPYMTVSVFVVLTNGLFVHYKCFDNSRGYMCWSALRISLFLAIVFSLQSLLGVCIYEFVLPSIYPTQFILQKTFTAGLSGFLASVFPNGVVGWAVTSYLSRKDVRLAKDLSRSADKVLVRIWLLSRFRFEVQYLKSLDNFKAQFQSGWWNFSLSPDQRIAEREAARRIRRLYEVFKIEIANKERDPNLLDIAPRYHPGNKFFLLVAFLGRRRLRELLAAPPLALQPGCDWDGSERRRDVGTKADRNNLQEQAEYSRIGDDMDLRQRVKRGEWVESLKRTPQ